MASFTFEDSNQSAATQFVAGDTLSFRTANPMDVGVSYWAGGITLSYDGKALTFTPASLDHGAAIVFNWGGGVFHQIEFGGQGSDFLSYYLVRDRAVWTFDGDDHVTLGGPGRVALHTGDGNDLVEVDQPVPQDPGYRTGEWRIDAGAGDDIVALHFANGPVTVSGGSGRDTIEGGSHNDHLYGNLAGVAGDDDRDSIVAGAGNDYVHAGAGDDLVLGDTGNDRLYGGAGDDALYGEDGYDYIQGNKGADLIRGAAGNDTIRGGADNDLLNGNDGDDMLMGDNGDDVLRGGTGADTLSGGAGADRFAYAAGDALSPGLALTPETILDFEDAIDMIGLSFAVDVVWISLLDESYAVGAGGRGAAADALWANPASGKVTAMEMGADTWLVFSGNGGSTTDSIIVLRDFDAADIDVTDFL